MKEIAPLSKGAVVESVTQPVYAPLEPRQPWGRQLTSVQPHPTPIIASTEKGGENTVEESAKKLHVAQMRAEITGTGNLVDVIV